MKNISPTSRNIPFVFSENIHKRPVVDPRVISQIVWMHLPEFLEEGALLQELRVCFLEVVVDKIREDEARHLAGEVKPHP